MIGWRRASFIHHDEKDNSSGQRQAVR